MKEMMHFLLIQISAVSLSRSNVASRSSRFLWCCVNTENNNNNNNKPDQITVAMASSSSSAAAAQSPHDRDPILPLNSRSRRPSSAACCTGISDPNDDFGDNNNNSGGGGGGSDYHSTATTSSTTTKSDHDGHDYDNGSSNNSQPVVKSKEDVARLRPTTTVLQGPMYVRSSGLLGGTWQRYHVVLKRSCLVYKRKRSDRRIAGFVNLSKVAIWPGESECGRVNSIMIYHPNRTTQFLAADSPASAREWMLAIRRVKEFLDWVRRDKQEEDDYTSSSDEEREVSCFGKRLFRFSIHDIITRRKPRAHDLLFEEVRHLFSMLNKTALCCVALHCVVLYSIFTHSLAFPARLTTRAWTCRVC